MNNKDKSINSLLNKLNLKKRGWIIVDHWDGDQCSIGITNSHKANFLVYISTFGKNEGTYDYECEMYLKQKNTEYILAEKNKNVSYNDLLNTLIRYLK